MKTFGNYFLPQLKTSSNLYGGIQDGIFIPVSGFCLKHISRPNNLLFRSIRNASGICNTGGQYYLLFESIWNAPGIGYPVRKYNLLQQSIRYATRVSHTIRKYYLLQQSIRYASGICYNHRAHPNTTNWTLWKINGYPG